MKRALNSSNQSNEKATNKRAATAAMRGKNKPMPQAKEMKAHTYASTSRAGRLLDTGCHTGAKSPLIRPSNPTAIIVAAKTA
jgi:hypothetical protein